ncbi:hypothetical protein GO013_16455 [Pseudodesulfovibrio sp. JC047]|uniref:hypothetical protein n=1 Tax=Pseudodesulfovibrio sp. JC047 TaxID=2683199 RepID=UPI0013CF4422|nr:hypothetical protein [Pseudodesulfovibrio sp. JC047]NDV21004.1 hypothetical protein [Pseudodesulfovibrio sp. JC047]
MSKEIVVGLEREDRMRRIRKLYAQTWPGMIDSLSNEVERLKGEHKEMLEALEHAINTIPAGEDWSLEHLGSYLEQVVARVKGE